MHCLFKNIARIFYTGTFLYLHLLCQLFSILMACWLNPESCSTPVVPEEMTTSKTLQPMSYDINVEYSPNYGYLFLINISGGVLCVIVFCAIRSFSHWLHRREVRKIIRSPFFQRKVPLRIYPSSDNEHFYDASESLV